MAQILFGSDSLSELRAAEACDRSTELRARALGGLTGQFSHELRNVLTGVRCYIEILAGVPLPAEMAGYLGEVQSGLDRMTDLAALWHDLARARGATPYLNGEVSRVLQLLRAAGVSKRTQLSENFDPGVGLVAEDGAALEAVLLTLFVALIERSPGTIEVSTRAEGEHARLCLEALHCKAEAPGELDRGELRSLLAGDLEPLAEPRCGFELCFAIDGTVPEAY